MTTILMVTIKSGDRLTGRSRNPIKAGQPLTTAGRLDRACSSHQRFVAGRVIEFL